MSRDQREVVHGLVLLRGLAPAGFAVAMHLRMMTPSFLFQSYPVEWVDAYSREGLILRDPTVRWGASGGGGMRRWSDFQGEDDSDIFERAAEHGLRFGVTWSARGSALPSFGGMARGDRDFTEAEIGRIGEVLDRIHEATASLDDLDDEVQEKVRDMSIFLTQDRKVRRDKKEVCLAGGQTV
jgi:LuxR family transcriptional regulator, quorum-sensing system regulator SdiA